MGWTNMADRLWADIDQCVIYAEKKNYESVGSNS